MGDLERLRQYLDSFGNSSGSASTDLPNLLARAWNELDGGDQESMHAGKLHRIETAEWQPPVLTFTIERHGGTVLGSTRAEVQTWAVNLDTATASIVGTTHRQLRSMAPRLNVEPIAREVAELIAEGADDPRLRWSADRSSVHVVASECLPPAYEQTMAGRRKRLWAALAAELQSKGWHPSAQRGRYERT
jgi:hypothetical protein